MCARPAPPRPDPQGGLQHLANLQSLQRLAAGWCKALGDMEVVWLRPLTALTHLCLSYTQVGALPA